MNKKVLVIVAVLLLLLLGGWYFMSGKKRATTPATETSGGNGNQQQTTSAVGTLKDILGKGVAQSCTYSNAGSTGAVYTSGGKVRGDFDVTVNSVATKSHMIVMDSTSYMWTDGQKTGFKMSFDPNATPATGSTAAKAPSGAVDPSANMNYNCGPWVVDATMFNLPTGVTFQSFNVPTQQGTSGGSSSSSQCSYCDSLTGDSKTQCRAALKCN
jgi:hypothetical protein